LDSLASAADALQLWYEHYWCLSTINYPDSSAASHAS